MYAGRCDRTAELHTIDAGCLLPLEQSAKTASASNSNSCRGHHSCLNAAVSQFPALEVQQSLVAVTYWCLQYENVNDIFLQIIN